MSRFLISAPRIRAIGLKPKKGGGGDRRAADARPRRGWLSGVASADPDLSRLISASAIRPYEEDVIALQFFFHRAPARPSRVRTVRNSVAAGANGRWSCTPPCLPSARRDLWGSWRG